MQKIGDRQRRVLEYLSRNPGQRATAHVFNEICGSAPTVRSLFSKGLVEGDSIPAVYVRLTDAGRTALNGQSGLTN